MTNCRPRTFHYCVPRSSKQMLVTKRNAPVVQTSAQFSRSSRPLVWDKTRDPGNLRKSSARGRKPAAPANLKLYCGHRARSVGRCRRDPDSLRSIPARSRGCRLSLLLMRQALYEDSRRAPHRPRSRPSAALHMRRLSACQRQLRHCATSVRRRIGDRSFLPSLSSLYG